MDNDYTIRSLERALLILKSFNAKNRELSLPEICSMTGLSKSTAFRMLITLEKHHFIATNANDKYFPGSEITRLAQYADDNIILRKLAYPYLNWISARTGETVILTGIKNDHLLCIDKVESRQVIRISSEIGVPISMFRGATGKVVGAFLDEFQLIRCLEEERRLFQVVIDKKQIEQNFAKIRKEKAAFSNSEIDRGVMAVSAPIFEEGDRIIGSISMAAPEMRFSHEKAMEVSCLLKKAAEMISGHREFDEDAMEGEE